MLAETLSYTSAADAQFITIFKAHPSISDKAILLFSHVLNAQHVWAHRILGLKPIYGIWETHQITDFETISSTNFKLFNQIITEVSLAQEISYTNTKGESHSGVVKDLLFHVVNHSTYHRGQLATIFKADGIVPPATDFFLFKRNHL